MKKLLLLITTIFIHQISIGQNIDSLRNALKSSTRDTNYAKTLLRLSQVYYNKKQDSSIYFGNQVFTLQEKAQPLPIQRQAHMFIAYAYYMKGDYKNSIASFKKMYEAASRTGDKTNMAIAINNEGNVYIETGDYTTAISKYKEAKAIHQSMKDDFGIARCYNNIGFVYKEMGEYDKSIENFLHALVYFEKTSSLNEVAMLYNNITPIYLRQKNLAKALEYNKMALAIQSKTNNRGGKAISLNFMGIIHEENKDYKNALRYFNEAFDIYKSMNDKRQIALMYSTLGQLHYDLGSFDSSVIYYEQAIAMNKQMGNNKNLANALLGNAASLIALNQVDRAASNLDTAELIIKATNKKEDYLTYYKTKSALYDVTGNNKQSLDYYKKYAAQKDEIYNEESAKTIADLNIKYETEKKKLQIDLLNKENSLKDSEIKIQKLALTKRAYDLARQQLALANATLVISDNELEIKNQQAQILQKRIDSTEAAQQLLLLSRQANIQRLELHNQRLLNARKNTFLIVILIVAVLLSLLGYSYYRRYRLQQAAKLHASILEQQELATNAVLAAEENERRRIAGDLHDGLGQIMSAAKMNLSVMQNDLQFTSADQEVLFAKVIHLVDESIKEVRSVSHSMMPNALLKAGLASAINEFIKQIDKRVIKIQLHTEGLNERIDQNIESILYRVVQECVTNVIKHANATQLDISIIKTEDRIEATIEDNGKGFDISTIADSGIGLKNIQSRINFLKGEIEWSSHPGQGTLVAFHVPVYDKILQP